MENHVVRLAQIDRSGDRERERELRGVAGQRDRNRCGRGESGSVAKRFIQQRAAARLAADDAQPGSTGEVGRVDGDQAGGPLPGTGGFHHHVGRSEGFGAGNRGHRTQIVADGRHVDVERPAHRPHLDLHPFQCHPRHGAVGVIDEKHRRRQHRDRKRDPQGAEDDASRRTPNRARREPADHWIRPECRAITRSA